MFEVDFGIYVTMERCLAAGKRKVSESFDVVKT